MNRFEAPDPLRLLVVNRDDHVNRRLARAAAETELFAPAERLNDGRFALEQIVERIEAKAAAPDLVITGGFLTGLNGFQLVRELRRYEQARCIFTAMLTALGDPLEHDAAENAGCDFFLRTPTTPGEYSALLLSLANRCLTRISPPNGMLG